MHNNETTKSNIFNNNIKEILSINKMKKETDENKKSRCSDSGLTIQKHNNSIKKTKSNNFLSVESAINPLRISNTETRRLSIFEYPSEDDLEKETIMKNFNLINSRRSCSASDIKSSVHSKDNSMPIFEISNIIDNEGNFFYKTSLLLNTKTF